MPPASSPDETLLAQAAAWRVRLADGGAAQRAGFERWLAESGENLSAWRTVQAPWELLGTHATAADVLALRRAALVGATPPPERVRVPRRALVGIAAAALLLALAGFLYFDFGKSEVYRTGVSERRVIGLADGSELALDSASEVRVRFTRSARQLQLRRGQARFSVAHERRPFTVAAGSRTVLATGTVFNVDLLKDSLVVTLMQGQVMVMPGPGGAPAGEHTAQGAVASPQMGAVWLRPGEQLAIDVDGAAHKRRANLANASAWEAGRLSFQDERLSNVLERFGRHTARTLHLDESAAGLRISGVFDANDLDGFLATIAAYLPVRTLPDGDGAIDVVSALQ